MKTAAFWSGLREELTQGLLPRTIKGVLWCILYGMGVGATVGATVGVAIGGLAWLVGAFIGGPVGLLLGAAVGGVCGLLGGILGGRWGWTLGGGLGLAFCIAAAVHKDMYLFDDSSVAPLLILIGAFILGAGLGWYCYRRVWDEKPGIQAQGFQEWRLRLMANGYERTTLFNRIIAGWAIVGTSSAIFSASAAVLRLLARYL